MTTESHYLIRDIISNMSKKTPDYSDKKVVNAINLLYEKLTQLGIKTNGLEITIIDKILKIK